jgi:hypothetical protein
LRRSGSSCIGKMLKTARMVSAQLTKLPNT